MRENPRLRGGEPADHDSPERRERVRVGGDRIRTDVAAGNDGKPRQTRSPRIKMVAADPLELVLGKARVQNHGVHPALLAQFQPFGETLFPPLAVLAEPDLDGEHALIAAANRAQNAPQPLAVLKQRGTGQPALDVRRGTGAVDVNPGRVSLAHQPVNDFLQPVRIAQQKLVDNRPLLRPPLQVWRTPEILPQQHFRQQHLGVQRAVPAEIRHQPPERAVRHPRHRRQEQRWRNAESAQGQAGWRTRRVHDDWSILEK